MKNLSMFLLIVALVGGAPGLGQDFDSTVEGYRETADQLIKSGRQGNDAYLKLQELCDDIGGRLSGSPALDQAIRWAQESLKADGQQNVVAEKVMVRKWERGSESCYMISPRRIEIGMLGLGGSVATPPEGITAEVIVVKDRDALDALPDDAIDGRL